MGCVQFDWRTNVDLLSLFFVSAAFLDFGAMAIRWLLRDRCAPVGFRIFLIHLILHTSALRTVRKSNTFF